MFLFEDGELLSSDVLAAFDERRSAGIGVLYGRNALANGFNEFGIVAVLLAQLLKGILDGEIGLRLIDDLESDAGPQVARARLADAKRQWPAPEKRQKRGDRGGE